MTRREEDMIAWRAWHSNPTTGNLQVVLERLRPIIHTEVNRWQGTLARPLLEIEAHRLAAEAIMSYSPTGGAALATHVTNRLKKLSRLSYTHQNIARIPEHQALQYHNYTSGQSYLENKQGREPTGVELAEHLGWSKPYLTRFQKSLRKEFLESGTTVPIFDTTSDDAKVIDFVYNDLSPQQQQIFQNTTGYMGSPILSNAQMMRKLKITQGQLSYQKKLMTDHLGKATGGGIA